MSWESSLTIGVIETLWLRSFSLGVMKLLELTWEENVCLGVLVSTKVLSGMLDFKDKLIGSLEMFSVLTVT